MTEKDRHQLLIYYWQLEEITKTIKTILKQMQAIVEQEKDLE
jgi:hypothetical protein